MNSSKLSCPYKDKKAFASSSVKSATQMSFCSSAQPLTSIASATAGEEALTITLDNRIDRKK